MRATQLCSWIVFPFSHRLRGGLSKNYEPINLPVTELKAACERMQIPFRKAQEDEDVMQEEGTQPEELYRAGMKMCLSDPKRL